MKQSLFHVMDKWFLIMLRNFSYQVGATSLAYHHLKMGWKGSDILKEEAN